MPRRAKVAPATRRAWLEAFDHGRRLDSIAAGDGYSVRTVKRHLEVARRERDQEKVRVNLLSEAYQRHSDDLLGLAQELGKRAEKPSVHGLWPDADRRTGLLRDGLRSHIPGSDLWGACARWDERAPRMDIVRKGMRQRIVKRVDEWARQRLPKADVDTLAASLWFAVQESAAGRGVLRIKYRTKPAGEGLHLYWGDYLFVDTVSDESEAREAQSAHRQILSEVAGPTSHFVTGWKEVVERWEEARDRIQEEVEILLLRRMLPGQCFLCPGDAGKRGMGNRRRRRAGDR